MENIAIEICNLRGYTFRGRVGAGGFKTTFKISDKKNNFMALKIFGKNSNLIRMEREIDTMKRLNKPNIAKLYEIDKVNIQGQEYNFCIEEFCNGGTLMDRLQIDCVDRAHIIQLGNDLFGILKLLISEELLHRDIKPNNILFRDNNWNMVLTDFGIVRDLNKTSITATYFPGGPHTPGYGAPEQVYNKKVLQDWRTDQYAIGITLGICATRIHPYKMDQDLADKGIIDPSFLILIKQKKLEVILKMIAPFPVMRYRDVDVLIQDWNN